MKQKRLVSMIGALVVIISAVALITGCPQANGNNGKKDNTTLNNDGNSGGSTGGNNGTNTGSNISGNIGGNNGSNTSNTGGNTAGNSDDVQKDTTLTLFSLSVIYKVKEERIEIEMDETSGTVTVPNAITEIASENIFAFFKRGNESYGSYIKDVTVENGTLNVGNNKVKLAVAAVSGEHESWSGELNVIRNTLPDNSLIPVTPPKEGIIGAAANKEDFPFVGTNYASGTQLMEHFQGVFIEGRKVILSPFNMAETETTYKLWKEVYDWATDPARGTNKYTFANKGKKGGSWDTIKPPPPPSEVTELEPVTKVSWYDCIVWCNAYTEKQYGSDAECVYRKSDTDNSVCRDATVLTEHYLIPYFDKTKKGFRLPTEAEWEYAARVQSDGTLCPLSYMSGAGGNCIMDRFKFARYVAINGYDKTSEVKCRAANALGLYDMSGNVSELCWDARDYDSAVGTGIETNPSPHSGYIIIRGGSFNSRFEFALVGAVKTCGSNETEGDDGAVGFRVCQYH